MPREPREAPLVAAGHWIRVTRQLTDPAVELDSDVFALVLQSFHRYVRSGATIDEGLRHLMRCLERQMLDGMSDSDSDDDHLDDFYVDGDDDEDGSDPDTCGTIPPPRPPAGPAAATADRRRHP